MEMIAVVHPPRIGRDCKEEGGRRRRRWRGEGRGTGCTEEGIGYWAGVVVERRHSWLVRGVVTTA